MTRNAVFAAAATLAFSQVAWSQGQATGDPAAGEAAFRQCIACHVVVNDAGETLAGRNARTGPNLYALGGRTAGSLAGFRYSPALGAAAEAGLVWDEATFVGYVQDPTGYLRDVLADPGARGSMAFRVRNSTDALNLYAYLVSLSE
ncbi:MAG: cytochrome C [Pseudomonadota bacterium]